MKLISTKDYLLLIDEESRGIEFGEIGVNMRHSKLEVETRNMGGYGSGKYYWYHKKCLAYYPLTKEAKELDLPLLPNPFKTYRVGRKQKRTILDENGIEIGIFKTGSELEAQNYCDYLNNKQFSLEDVRKAFKAGIEFQSTFTHKDAPNLEEYLQSLSTQQLPKEFIPKIEYFIRWKTEWTTIYQTDRDCETRLKTTTNSEGKRVLLGTYKY